MFAYPHKIFDPIHSFIRFDSCEKKVIDSPFFQRLRYIRQMGVAYLLYPGANHTRFEHSLGVMELVSRMYDTITAYPFDTKLIPDGKEELLYWRQVLRLAALCHDMGHLPFSHTAEKEILKEGHEAKTIEMIESPQMHTLWQHIPSNGRDIAADIVKLAVGSRPNLKLSAWEKMLAQLITEDNFGADRIDYLIRDARYTGVGYGQFDAHQLIDSVRLLPGLEAPKSLTIGVLESGVQSVESLWMARYLMYERVYHHRKARIYTKHMSRFIQGFFARHGFPTSLEGYLDLADHSILIELKRFASSGDYDAKALLHEIPPYKMISLPKNYPIALLEPKLTAEFKEGIFIDHLAKQVVSERLFSVVKYDGSIAASTQVSQFLRDIPMGGHSPCIYARPDLFDKVSTFVLTSV